MKLSPFSSGRPNFLRRVFAKKEPQGAFPDSSNEQSKVEEGSQLRHPEVPMTIDIPLGKAATIPSSSKDPYAALKLERQSIYYLQTEGVSVAFPTASTRVNATKGGNHKRSATLETLGTNYSGGAYEDLDDAMQAIPGITLVTTTKDASSISSKTSSDENNDSDSDGEAYLVMVEEELEHFLATRRDKLTEEDMQVLFMNQVTKYVMEQHEKKRQERQSSSWFGFFGKKGAW